MSSKIKVFKRKNAILPELIEDMASFRKKISERIESKFYGMITGQLLKRLPPLEYENLQTSFQVSGTGPLNFYLLFFSFFRIFCDDG